MDQVLKKTTEAMGKTASWLLRRAYLRNFVPLFLHQRFIYPEFLFNYAWKVDSMGIYLHLKRGDWIQCCGAFTFQDGQAILFVSFLIISGIF